VTETDADAAGDSPSSSTVPLANSLEIGRDPAAHSFDAVYAEQFPFVWRCLRGLGVHPAGLDDAAQDVFIVVHRRLGEFRGDSTLRTWLYGIVRHVAANQRRSLQRRGRPEPLDFELPSRSPDPGELAEVTEAVELLERFLQQLDAGKREVFMLALIEEMSMPEIAKALSIPVNTAYTRLRLARAQLQRALLEGSP